MADTNNKNPISDDNSKNPTPNNNGRKIPVSPKLQKDDDTKLTYAQQLLKKRKEKEKNESGGLFDFLSGKKQETKKVEIEEEPQSIFGSIFTKQETEEEKESRIEKEELKKIQEEEDSKKGLFGSIFGDNRIQEEKDKEKQLELDKEKEKEIQKQKELEGEKIAKEEAIKKEEAKKLEKQKQEEEKNAKDQAELKEIEEDSNQDNSSNGIDQFLENDYSDEEDESLLTNTEAPKLDIPKVNVIGTNINNQEASNPIIDDKKEIKTEPDPNEIVNKQKNDEPKYKLRSNKDEEESILDLVDKKENDTVNEDVIIANDEKPKIIIPTINQVKLSDQEPERKEENAQTNQETTANNQDQNTIVNAPNKEEPKYKLKPLEEKSDQPKSEESQDKPTTQLTQDNEEPTTKSKQDNVSIPKANNIDLINSSSDNSSSGTQTRPTTSFGTSTTTGLTINNSDKLSDLKNRQTTTEISSSTMVFKDSQKPSLSNNKVKRKLAINSKTIVIAGSKPFNPDREVVRGNISKNRKEKLAKQGKLKRGLLLLLASIGLASSDVAKVNAGLIPDIDNNQPQVEQNKLKNFLTEDSTPIYKPISVDDKFEIKESVYNEEGQLTENTNKTQKQKERDKAKDPSRASYPGISTNEPSVNIGQNSDQNYTKEVPNYNSTQNNSEQTSPDQGEYVDGVLKTPNIVPIANEFNRDNKTPRYSDINKGTSQPNNQSSPYQQQSQGLPAQSFSTSDDQPSGASYSNKGKKEDIKALIAKEILKAYAAQGLLFAIIIVITIFGILGILFFSLFKLLEGVCSSGALLNTAKAAAILGNNEARQLIDTCDAFQKFSGIGCPASDSQEATGVSCIGTALDQSGDSLRLFNLKGPVNVKKSIINEIIKAGKEAKVNDFTIRFTIAIHPVESLNDGFKTKNNFGCLGIGQFCPLDGGFSHLKSYTDENQFLNSPSAQMSAIDQFLNNKRSNIQNEKKSCVLDEFKSKSELYKLAYVWLKNTCPNDADANGTTNVDYAKTVEKNFNATDCNDFKTKIAKNDFTEYWKIFNSISTINLTPTAKAQTSATQLASPEEQAKVVALIKEGKINTELSPQSAYIADVTGDKSYRNRWGQSMNGPIHSNTAKMMILLAEKFPGWFINALGNSTHSPTGGSHNKTPILAIDVGSTRAPYVSTDAESLDKMQAFFKVLEDSKLVAKIGLPPSDKARVKTSLEVFRDGPGHIHISINGTGTLGSDIGSGTDLCTYSKANEPEVQDGNDVNGRLNKKSLTDDEWKIQQGEFGLIRIANEFVKIGDDTIDNATPKQLKLFNSQAATDRIYKLALEAGYKYRKVINTSELDAGTELRLKKEAKVALKEMILAANKDGYKMKLVSGFRSPEDQKVIFETKLQELCKAKINQTCAIDDIANGKHDDLIKERLTKSSVPYVSKHHTGIAADINQSNLEQLEQISSSELYKWLEEDNYFNMKRFGFIPSYPDGGTNMGPFPEPWEVLYVGKERLKIR
jgi:LAS superfamily LD-carboxypeptidase LdcB